MPVRNRWTLHSYYSLCPYAPDNSGRILAAGADLKSRVAEVLILSPNGTILDHFGAVPTTDSFWHTGLWQSWSPDSRKVYFQTGTLRHPRTTRFDLLDRSSVTVGGDIEGIPPLGEPALSCEHGMLYAAGYGSGRYDESSSPVPFQAREQHGISRLSFSAEDPPRILLSTREILERHPMKDRILEEDRKIKKRLGSHDGLTLMTYCVRWNRRGDRCLFFFGNHCVAKTRGEPRITTVFTADHHLEEIHMAIDLSFERRGVHWAWQADNEHLIGYGPSTKSPSQYTLSEIRYDGTGYRNICDHASGGHPSTCPADHDLIVTDEGIATGGNIVFISRRTGKTLKKVHLPKFNGETEPPGRNPNRICHHPVFNREGDRILCNSMPNENATLVEIRNLPQIS
ncbi:hypothetical protein [Puniceicoccus vermicola]|uniref:hypothetical protein n=1 Tax=Puniceicoccus vermicola TaxID=388746 RepID=UPI003394E4ED